MSCAPRRWTEFPAWERLKGNKPAAAGYPLKILKNKSKNNHRKGLPEMIYSKQQTEKRRMITSSAPDRDRERAALNALEAATGRGDIDRRDIEKLSAAKRKMERMKHSLAGDDSVSSKEKKAVLGIMINGMKKVISLRKKTLKRCIAIGAVSLAILTGALSASGPDAGKGKTGPAEEFFLDSRGGIEHSEERLSVNDPVRGVISFSENDESPVTSLSLRFPDGRHLVLECRLKDEKDLLYKVSGDIVERYGFAPEAVPNIRETIADILEKTGRDRVFTGGGRYFEIHLPKVIAQTFSRMGKTLEKTVSTANLKKELEKETVLNVVESRILKMLEARGIENSREKAKEYAESIYKAHRSYGVSPFVLTGIMERESGGNADAESSSKQGYGLMQINWNVHKVWIPKYFPHIRTLEDVKCPENNIMLGAAIYAGKLKQHGGDQKQALLAYLGGDNINYARFILNRAKEMERDKKIVASMNMKKMPGTKMDFNTKDFSMEHSDIFL